MTLDEILDTINQNANNLKQHGQSFAKGAATTIGLSVGGALAIASLSLPLYGGMAGIESLQATSRKQAQAKLVSKRYQTMPNTHSTYVQGTFATADGDTLSACDCPRITEGKPFANTVIAFQDTGKTYDVAILETKTAGYNTGNYVIAADETTAVKK